MPSMAGTSSVRSPRAGVRGLCAERDRALVGVLGVDHAERHRRARTARARRRSRAACVPGSRVDEVVDVALPVEADVLGRGAGRRGVKPMRPEQLVQRSGVGMGEFDELEAVGSHRIVLRRSAQRGRHAETDPWRPPVCCSGRLRRLDHGPHARCVRNSLAGGASAHGSCRPGPADARLGREGRWPRPALGRVVVAGQVDVRWPRRRAAPRRSAGRG